jgi:hypothetical protein
LPKTLTFCLSLKSNQTISRNRDHIGWASEKTICLLESNNRVGWNLLSVVVPKTPTKEEGNNQNDFQITHIISTKRAAQTGLQLRRAIGIQAEEKRLLEKHAIAPSAARLCFSGRCHL